MAKQCRECNSVISNQSPRYDCKIYCNTRCQKAFNRKKNTQLSRAQRGKANILQNEQFLHLIRECKRAGTVQILTGHSVDSFKDTIELVRKRPKGSVSLCHIAPVKGDASVGLFHGQNLFYGGTHQNRKFGKKYFSGGLSIDKDALQDKWRVNNKMSNNEVLLLVENFLGDVIIDYLKSTFVKKSRKHKIAQHILELEGKGDLEELMMLSYSVLIARRDILRRRHSFMINYEEESKFIAYMDSLTRFIRYGGINANKFRRLRKLMVVAYMALERVKESRTYNKYFYVQYEFLIERKYAYVKLANPAQWSEFKDFVYDAVFCALQGKTLNVSRFCKRMKCYLEFPSKSSSVPL